VSKQKQAKTETVAVGTAQVPTSPRCKLTGMRVLGTPERYVAGIEPQSMFPALRGQRVVDIVSDASGCVRVLYANGAYEEYGASAVSLLYEERKQ